MSSMIRILALLAILAPRAALAEFALVMVEEPGCIYCARWTAEIGPEFPVSPEGRFAPLRRVDITDLPEDLTLASRPVYTPTFILTENGTEIGRLEGYAGEEFFWHLLGQLLARGDADWQTAVAH